MEKLKCELCGNYYSHLGSHIWHRHKITAREYKEKYGLNYNHPLITKDIQNKKKQVFEKDRTKYLKNLDNSAVYQFKKGNQPRTYFSQESLTRAKQELKEMKLKGPCPVCGMMFDNVFIHMRLKHDLLVVNLNAQKYKK